jgi:hypothetical protein
MGGTHVDSARRGGEPLWTRAVVDDEKESARLGPAEAEREARRSREAEGRVARWRAGDVDRFTAQG